MAYLSAYIPEANSAQRSVKTSWAGLNRLQTQDSGELSYAANISMRELPYLASAKTSKRICKSPEADVLSIYDVGDGSFVVIYRSQDETRGLAVNYVTREDMANGKCGINVGNIEDEGVVPSVAVFNVYEDNGGNIVTAGFTRRILIYPQCCSFDPEADKPVLESFNIEGNTVPKLKHVTVMNGRVFGVLDGKFYASEWNSYAGWNLPAPDTLTEDIPSMAWVSTTQSDVDASGDFTGITVYDGHVIGFKRNFMHMLYNNKNPFRIVDVAKIGAISQEAICEVGQILFFVADDGVYAFTGGYPKRISDKLNIKAGDWQGSRLGGDDRTLYCFVPQEGTFTYDTVNGAWGYTYEDITSANLATVDSKCLYALDDGIYEFGASHDNDFRFATDASFGGALVEKKIKRIRLQVSHKNHQSGDCIEVYVLRSDRTIAAEKRITPSANIDTVISMLTRMTCDFGQKIQVEGKGDWVIKYLQIDYESGGEKYV